MGRKRRLWCAVLITVISCGTIDMGKSTECRETEIIICAQEMTSRAADPDENIICDLTVFIFDENGILEEKKVFGRNELEGKGSFTFRTTLLKEKRYCIYACANIGKEIHAESVSELEDIRCHLAYPDEYREGIPMAGKIENAWIDDGMSEIRLALERIMAKISLRIDRGGLSDDVRMTVISARIGNCPKSARIFCSNSVSGQDECFTTGFTRTESECRILNTNIDNGISGSLTLYMLENMQGEFGGQNIQDDSEKIFGTYDSRQYTCSYIELKIDYESDSYYTSSHPLIYRFYLGESRNNLDVQRNCHYRITVIPEDDGLSENSWRVDKSGMIPADKDISFEMTPSGYIQGNVGDEIHVRCSFRPKTAEFDIGIEELEYDKSRGIYGYTIDEDGLGVKLHLESPGTGIIYMTAGEPVNEAGMLVIEVNDIKNNIT